MKEPAPTESVLPLSDRLPKPSRAVVLLDQIDPSPFNKRVFRENDPRDLDLTNNLRATGQIIEPLVVRPDGDRFRLIAGERRLRSGRAAGLVKTEVMIYDVDEQTANLMTFVENHFRVDLHYLEEAAAIEGLLASGLTQEMIAAQIGKPVKWVALRARLSTLSDRWRELAFSDDPQYSVRLWTAHHLEVVALLSQEAQDGLLTTYSYLIQSEPTVSELRGLVAESTRQLSGAPWRLDDDTLCPQAGSCSTCTLRTSVHPTLFEDLVEESKSSKDRCLNSSCWNLKVGAYLARREAELRLDHPNLVLMTTGSNRQAGAVQAWSVRPAKKKQPGAVPALVLDGSDRGKMRWIIPPPAKPAAVDVPRESSAPIPGQRAKTPLAIRQKALERRRKFLATQAIEGAVAESPVVPPLKTILAFASVFGTEHTLSAGSVHWDLSANDRSSPAIDEANPVSLPLWDLAETLLREEVDLDEASGRLWRRVCPVLLKRTANIGTPEDTLRAYEEGCKLAALVGVDSALYLREATAALPDPRSWAEEEAAMARAGAAENQEPDVAALGDPAQDSPSYALTA